MNFIEKHIASDYIVSTEEDLAHDLLNDGDLIPEIDEDFCPYLDSEEDDADLEEALEECDCVYHTWNRVVDTIVFCDDVVKRVGINPDKSLVFLECGRLDTEKKYSHFQWIASHAPLAQKVKCTLIGSFVQLTGDVVEVDFLEEYHQMLKRRGYLQGLSRQMN